MRGVPGVWLMLCPPPLLPGRLPGVKVLQGSRDGLRSYYFWTGLWLKPGVCPNVRIVIVGGRAKRHAVLEQPFWLPVSGGLRGAVPTGGGGQRASPGPCLRPHLLARLARSCFEPRRDLETTYHLKATGITWRNMKFNTHEDFSNMNDSCIFYLFFFLCYPKEYCADGWIPTIFSCLFFQEGFGYFHEGP